MTQRICTRWLSTRNVPAYRLRLVVLIRTQQLTSRFIPSFTTCETLASPPTCNQVHDIVLPSPVSRKRQTISPRPAPLHRPSDVALSSRAHFRANRRPTRQTPATSTVHSGPASRNLRDMPTAMHRGLSALGPPDLLSRCDLGVATDDEAAGQRTERFRKAISGCRIHLEDLKRCLKKLCNAGTGWCHVGTSGMGGLLVPIRGASSPEIVSFAFFTAKEVTRMYLGHSSTSSTAFTPPKFRVGPHPPDQSVTPRTRPFTSTLHDRI